MSRVIGEEQCVAFRGVFREGGERGAENELKKKF